jgi:hypothetical protein
MSPIIVNPVVARSGDDGRIWIRDQAYGIVVALDEGAMEWWLGMGRSPEDAIEKALRIEVTKVVP